MIVITESDSMEGMGRKGKEKGNGLFVVCEGPDYSGKTTNMRMAVPRLCEAGYDAVYHKSDVFDPEVERQIYEIGRPEPFLYGIEIDTAERIRPLLEECDVLMQDRYLISVLAHLDEMENPVQWFVDRVSGRAERPDLLVYVTASVEEQMRRLKVETLHDEMLLKEPWKIFALDARYRSLVESSGCDCVEIDTTGRPAEETCEELVGAMLKKLDAQ